MHKEKILFLVLFYLSKNGYILEITFLNVIIIMTENSAFVEKF